MNFNVQSEVGQLRQVIVHRPGLELSRLTPQERRRAAVRRRAVGQEGQGGARCVRRGPPRQGRAGSLLRAAPGGDPRAARRPGLRPGPHLHAGHAGSQPDPAPARALRRPRRPGPGRVPGRRGAQGRPASGRRAQPEVGHAAGRRLRAAPPAQPPVPAGQLLLDLPGRLGQPDGQARPPARDAAQPGHLPLPPHVRGGGVHPVLRRRRRQPSARQHRGRRRARARPRRRDDRHGRAVHADGRRAAGRRAVPGWAGRAGSSRSRYQPRGPRCTWTR